MSKKNTAGIRSLLSEGIPLTGEVIKIKEIGVEELLSIRETMTMDKLRQMTCRPVVAKTTVEYKKLYNRQKENPDMFVGGIYHSISMELIGKISVFDHNTRNKSVEIGYYIIEEHRKKGYAYEALSILCDMLLGKMALNKVYAQTGAFNKGSKLLLERVGFCLDGVLREHHELNGAFYDDLIYSYLRKEWIEKRR